MLKMNLSTVLRLDPFLSFLAAFTLRIIKRCFWSAASLFEKCFPRLTFFSKDRGPSTSPCTRGVVAWYDTMQTYSLYNLSAIATYVSIVD